MDDYELQRELEAMAGAASIEALDQDTAVEESFERTVQRWQKLFDLTEDDAMDRIIQHRNDLGKVFVSDEHWNTVREEKEREGFNREAYEYSLNLEKLKVSILDSMPLDDGDTTSKVSFLVEMDGPLADLDAVREAAGLTVDPIVVSGQSAENWRPVELCCIDAKAKTALLRWASTTGKGYQPNILVNPKSLQS